MGELFYMIIHLRKVAPAAGCLIMTLMCLIVNSSYHENMKFHNPDHHKCRVMKPPNYSHQCHKTKKRFFFFFLYP